MGYMAETGRRDIRIIEPLSRAWEHMKAMLFPFDFVTWLKLGFIAWLSMLGQGGMNFNFRFPIPSDPRGTLDRALEYAKENIALVVVIGAAALLLSFAIYAALLYLRSRGVFMYLDAVYRRKCMIGEAWRGAATPAKSYFIWNLALSLCSMFVVLVLLAAGALTVWPVVRGAPWSWGVIVALAIIGLLGLLVVIAAGLVKWLLRSLVAPLMYLHGLDCNAAWRRLGDITAGYRGKIVLFWLMNIVLGLAVGMAVFPLMCFTCCIGLLPVVMQTVLQPFFLWIRAYGPYFVAQFEEPSSIEGQPPTTEPVVL